MKVYCSNCKNITNYSVLKQEQDLWGNEDIRGEDTYQIIQCKGCDEISFRHEYIDSDSCEPIVYQYPETGENKLSIKTDMILPRKVKIIYQETVKAYNNRQNILCAAGLRAIVEGVCFDRGVTEGNLKYKINDLHNQGLLTEVHSNILHQYRFLGNDAIHELDIPSIDELKIAIDIIEHTLENIYELNNKKEYLEFIRKTRQNK